MDAGNGVTVKENLSRFLCRFTIVSRFRERQILYVDFVLQYGKDEKVENDKSEIDNVENVQ